MAKCLTQKDVGLLTCTFLIHQNAWALIKGEGCWMYLNGSGDHSPVKHAFLGKSCSRTECFTAVSQSRC